MRSKTPLLENAGPVTVILVMSPASYRWEAFSAAARGIGLKIVRAIDMPEALPIHLDDVLPLNFSAPDIAVEHLVSYGRAHGPIAAILAIDDRGAIIAAEASAELGLPHNDPDSALAARDKFVMRERLHAGGVPVPPYRRVPAATDPSSIAGNIEYPCVVKPLLLSGSRGVIRANTPDEFVTAFSRTRAILEASGMSSDSNDILVEQFVSGFEVALEGLLTHGQLRTLALFDKPDPLDGPFFEETLYITPSRLRSRVQRAITERTAAAAAAIGLREGPIHAELRIDPFTADIWLIELAGRSIGGLCSSVLKFDAGMCLEELILRHAAGMSLPSTARDSTAAGAMMIPIPKSGMLRGVDGLEDARRVKHVTGIEITAPINQPIVPLPEGESYLGFIFARAETPEDVELALRSAHSRLNFRIEPMISLQPVRAAVR
jgi:biotin carboxylase